MRSGSAGKGFSGCALGHIAIICEKAVVIDGSCSATDQKITYTLLIALYREIFLFYLLSVLRC